MYMTMGEFKDKSVFLLKGCDRRPAYVAQESEEIESFGIINGKSDNRLNYSGKIG